MRHSLGKIGHGLRVAQLQILSRGLVHLGHDMQNHLATINESAGLMTELLQLKTRGSLGRATWENMTPA